ncbi:MAG: M20 family metallopeptidase [Chloroflexi bacterium]|nr:M20 family metallopeptidase [Chloroflexota bacterium]
MSIFPAEIVAQDEDGPPTPLLTAARTARLISLAQSLLRMPTVNPPGNEAVAAAFLADRLRDVGLEARTVPCGDGRASCVARLRGSSSRTGLILTGHLDVVPTGSIPWRHPPLAGTVDGDRLHGRGSVDMKGAVAAMVDAAITLAEAGDSLRGDLILALTAGEEVDMRGAQSLASGGHLNGASAIIVGEPTGFDLAIAEKGSYRLDIAVHGRAAHASTPHLGANAIGAGADLVQRIEALVPSAIPHPLLGTPTLSVGVIRGGSAANVVPDWCEIEVDARTIRRHEIEGMLDLVRATAEDLAQARGVTFDLTYSGFPPVETAADAAIVIATAAAVRSVARRAPEILGARYATDAAILAPMLGLPFVICGPGDPALAHQRDESVPLGELAQASAVYEAIAREWLA